LPGEGLEEDQDSLAAARAGLLAARGGNALLSGLLGDFLPGCSRDWACPGDQLNPSQQLAMERAPEPVVAHLVSPSGEDVLQEPAEELQGREGQCSCLAFSTIAIAERHLAAFNPDESAVGQGNPVHVAGEVPQDSFGPLDRGLTVEGDRLW
jgi:hypothetical protein